MFLVMLARRGHPYDLQAVCTTKEKATEITDALMYAEPFGATVWRLLSTGKHWVAATSTVGPLVIRITEEEVDVVRPSVDESFLTDEIARECGV